MAVNCNHAGIPLKVTDRLSKVGFDLSDREIERTVKSAYDWKPKSPALKKIKELPDEIPPPFSSSVFA